MVAGEDGAARGRAGAPRRAARCAARDRGRPRATSRSRSGRPRHPCPGVRRRSPHGSAARPVGEATHLPAPSAYPLSRLAARAYGHHQPHAHTSASPSTVAGGCPMSSETPSQTLENLGREDRRFPPSAEFAAQAAATERAVRPGRRGPRGRSGPSRRASCSAGATTSPRSWTGATRRSPSGSPTASSTSPTTASTGTSRPATATGSRCTSRASPATPAPSPTPS